MSNSENETFTNGVRAFCTCETCNCQRQREQDVRDQLREDRLREDAARKQDLEDAIDRVWGVR